MALKLTRATYIILPGAVLANIRQQWQTLLANDPDISYGQLLLNIDKGMFRRKGNAGTWDRYGFIKIPRSQTWLQTNRPGFYNQLTGVNNIAFVTDWNLFITWFRQFWDAIDFDNYDRWNNELFYDENTFLSVDRTGL